jgi:predicted O-methyltransferase YrrM
LLPRLLLRRPLPWDRVGARLDDVFIALDRSQGVFCYLLARALGARRIVEFGTSFGVSTIYLALAVRENGGGVVVGTERVAAKAARARAHIAEAGLADVVDLREGDARDTLQDLDGPVDMMLNDGFPPYALPVLQRVAPHLAPGAVVVADNVGAFPADHADYVTWVRDPRNGFVSARLALNEGTELSVRTTSWSSRR